MGFFRRFVASQLENPRYSLDSALALEMLGSRGSSTGLRVTKDTALSYSAYYRGVDLISGVVAKTRVYVYERQGDGKTKARQHAAWRLLLHQANELQNAFVWKRQMQMHALTCGNAYSYISRRGDGAPIELLPLDPDCTFPVRENGRLWYVTKLVGEERRLPAVDVFHIAGLSFDGTMGLSITEAAKETLGVGLAGSRYQALFFRNGGRPTVVLTTPQKLTDKTRQTLRQDWERMNTGLDNFHRTAILDGAVEAKTIFINPKDAQVLELLAGNVIELANFFGLPPHKLGNRESTSYASLEAENDAALSDCYDPWFVAWEFQAREKLLSEAEKNGDTHLIEFDRRDLVRANATARSGYFRTATGGRPWMTPDEVRQEEGYDPRGGEAAELKDPLNMGQGGAMNDPQGAGPADETPPPNRRNSRQTEEAHRELLAATVRRLVKRVGVHAERASRDPKKFLAWIETFRGEHEAAVAEACRPVQAACSTLFWEERAGDLSAWILWAMHADFERLVAGATPARFAGEIASLLAEQPGRLAEAAVKNFLGGSSDEV